MAFQAPVQLTSKNTQTWVINFAGSTAAGLGTSTSKQYGTIYRVQGGSSVATGTLPFSLSKNEAATIVDLYINAAVGNSGDFQFDIEVSNTSQKLFWDANAMLFSSNSRPRLPAPGIYIPPVAQVAFAAYWIVAQSTTVSVNVFALALVKPVRG